MRDPNRIDGVLKTLGKTWKKYPDLRLGQLILNLVENTLRGPGNLFYMEDDELAERIKNYGEKE